MALLKIHPKIEETLRFPQHGTIIDGAFATQAIDTSGEIIDIKGADISSLNEDGVLNTEHNNPDKKETATFSVIIGRIIFAKKVFSEQDCESERELRLWDDLKIPFIYGAAELFDAENHTNAHDAASIIKHYHKRNLPVVIRYSIEGSTLERNGTILTRTIGRRVAATIKPCNRSSHSAMVAEGAVPEKIGDFVEKGEKYIATNEMEFDVMIEDPFEKFVEGFQEFKQLTKALSLGSSDAAPSTYMGMSALGVEDMGGDKKKFFKAQVMAATRDWDRKTPFKDFLKHRLPDADPSFIDKYSSMTEDTVLGKAEPEIIDGPQLPKLESGSPHGAMKFKGKHVVPGELELIAGPFQGSKLKLVHLDDNYAYVQPFKSGDKPEVKINKIGRNIEGSHYIVSKPPEVLDTPNYVDAKKHGDLDTTKSFEQQQLMHGLNLAADPIGKEWSSTWGRAKPGTSYGWFKSANNKMGFVKPAVDYDGDEVKGKISTAKREAVFHNTAKNFFQLGSVPTASVFKHPDTGHEHSVSEMIPDAEHVQIRSHSHPSIDILTKEGDSGELDKNAIMDLVMGQRDRNRLNYMTSRSTQKVHLLDNALAFNYSDDFLPSYLLDYHQVKGHQLHDVQIHPNAAEWLIHKDPYALSDFLNKQKVPPEIVNEAVSRLVSMQSEAILGNRNLNQILLAHRKYTGTPNV
jgi:hypothetical protein